MQRLFQKISVLSFFCLIAIFGQAQTEKGRLMVGASFSQPELGLSDDFTRLNFSVKGSAGKFVADNLAVGTRLGVGYSRYVDHFSGMQDSRGISFEAGLFSRYYLPLGERIRPFVEMEVGTRQSFYRVNDESFATSMAYAQAMGGASFFFSKNASIDLSVGYRASSPLISPAIGSRPFGSLQANVGFSVFLNSGKKKQD